MSEVWDQRENAANVGRMEHSIALARRNVAALKAQRDQPKPPTKPLRLEGYLHMLKPEPLTAPLSESLLPE